MHCVAPLKALLGAVALAVFASSSAATLSPEQALGRLATGQDVPDAMLRAPRSGARLVSTGNTAQGSPAYYIFATDGSALIVSASDLTAPLLGYTDGGGADFDPAGMPPSMKWWLGEYARQIEWAEAHPVRPLTKVTATQGPQASQARASRAAIAPLCVTLWDQGAPYNNLCPTKGGTRTPTGCVATGMAQAMKYFGYPASGSGSNSYQWNGQTLSMDFSSTTFDWTAMQPSYTSSNPGTSAQRTAVATLMKACGYAVNMDYDTDASGALDVDLPNALINHFNYDKATSLEVRDYYDADTWAQMVYDNLRDVGPVIYCGQGDLGGHCFICDGYRTDGYFHINWGWAGASDGYFLLSALDPPTLGTGGGGGGFNSDQSAILGMRKPQSGSVLQQTWMAIYGGALRCSSSGRNLTFTVGSSGDGFFANMGPWTASITTGVQLTSTSSGAVTVPATLSLGSVPPGSGTRSLPYTLPSSVANGTYTARMVYKIGSGGEWKPFRYTYATNNYATITVSSSLVTVTGYGSDTGSGGGSGGGTDTDQGEVTVTPAASTTSMVAGEPFSLDATVSSTFSAAQTLKVSAYLCTVSDNYYHIQTTLGTQSVTVPPNSSMTATFAGTLSASLEAGTYYLVYADDDNNVLNDAQATVTVTTGGSAATGTVTVTPSEMSLSWAIGQACSATASVASTYATQQTFAVNAYLCSVDADGYYSVEATIATNQVTVPANSSKSATFSGTVPSEMTAGTYYLVYADDDANILNSRAIPTVTLITGSVQGGDVTVTPADTEASMVAGEAFSLDATVRSTYSTAQTLEITAYLCTVSDDSYLIETTLCTRSVTVPARSTVSAAFAGTLDASLEAGTYYLVYADDDNNVLNPTAIPTVTVTTGTASGTITVTPADTEASMVAGAAFSMDATVSSTFSTAQTLDVTAYLCTVSNNYYQIQTTLCTLTVTVPARSSVSAAFAGTLDSSLEAGTYYLVYADADKKVLNDTMVTVTVTEAAPAPTGGDGSAESPYTVAQVIAGIPASGAQAWVTGYVAGWVANAYTDQYVHFDAAATVTTNVVLGPTAQANDRAVCIPVQLPDGDVRTALNLRDNPGNLRRQVSILGTIGSYFGVPGLKSATKYNWGDTGTSGIADIHPDGDTEDAESGVRYYNLQGQPVQQPAPGGGVYIRVCGGKASKVAF